MKQSLEHLIEAARELVSGYDHTWLAAQAGLIAAAAVLAFGFAAIARRRIDLNAPTAAWPPMVRQVVQAVAANLGVILFAFLVAAMRAVMLDLTMPSHSIVLDVVSKLASAWVAVVLLTALIQNRFVHRIVVIVAWTIAALSILGLLDAVSRFMDSVAIVAGGLRISLLLVFKTVLLLLIALWIAFAAGNFFDRQLRTSADLTPSLQVLFGKLIRLTLVTLAVVIVLSSVGIDLTALALFSGAVGVGIGFGLQKIVSNLVSGIILLADKSIKPGDVISVGENFGWVDSMGARYTSVVVRDGREVLIPNEDLVTQRVVNWSFSNDQVRLEVQFGVSYASDPHRVRQLAIEAISTVPRVLKSPVPVCHLVKFNDFSLDFTLRFWIRDPVDGLANVRGEVLLALWGIFKREGIEIPFPVRDVRITEPMQVLRRPAETASNPT